MPPQRANVRGPAQEAMTPVQTEPSKSKRQLHTTRYPGIYWRDAKQGRRYVYEYRDSEGKQRFPTVEGGLEHARVEREKTLNRLRGGEAVRPFDNRLTFKEAAQQFFAVKAGGLSERTVETYKERLERVYPLIGHLQVTKIRGETIAALVAWLREQTNAKGERRYNEQTIKGTLQPVSRVLGYAKLSPNPVSLLERDERPKPDPREQRILSEEEIGKLIGATPPPTARWFRPRSSPGQGRWNS